MCTHWPGLTLENVLADALVRLVMVADGVSEEEMRVVLENARAAVAARDAWRLAAPPTLERFDFDQIEGGCA